jgi:hypothetical protein
MIDKDNASKKKILDQIVEWTISGKSKGEIKALLLKSAEIKEEKVLELIASGIKQIEEITNQDAATTINSHIEIYEQIIKYFEEVKYVPGINKARKAKEKLIGILNKKVVVNQNTSTVITRKVEYDLSKLDPVKRKRVEELINKATC